MKWRIFPVNCSKSTKLPLPPPNQNSHKHASVIQLVAVERDARKGRGRDNSPPCWFSWFFVELIPRKGSEEKIGGENRSEPSRDEMRVPHSVIAFYMPTFLEERKYACLCLSMDLEEIGENREKIGKRKRERKTELKYSISLCQKISGIKVFDGILKYLYRLGMLATTNT